MLPGNAVQNPSSQEYICLKVAVQMEEHLLQKAKHHTFISSKQTHIFWYKEWIFPLFPVTWVLLLGMLLLFLALGSVLPEQPHGRIMQIINLRNVPSSCHLSGDHVVNGWQEKPRGSGYRKGCHLFIYFPPQHLPQNTPLFGNRRLENKRNSANSNWRTVDLIGVHLADIGKLLSWVGKGPKGNIACKKPQHSGTDCFLNWDLETSLD